MGHPQDSGNMFHLQKTSKNQNMLEKIDFFWKTSETLFNSISRIMRKTEKPKSGYHRNNKIGVAFRYGLR